MSRVSFALSIAPMILGIALLAWHAWPTIQWARALSPAAGPHMTCATDPVINCRLPSAETGQ
ncbi:hypothetical protein [Ketogulonicigenium vulgare]|uniref:Uncharacterized protein n=1 Tax=Ketogulonicigenium vulgare (strain WSH-001) TaxID=759362 RepID=F9YA25_KETVW|nr:hypothetical protein [Ketogulonicigenium vulgare]ADO43138.1 hypothetical protein EIO_2029 [Ketogulonicigenium vulgare Y25]AEM41436.1 hypothetical protein KVU_1597 [Ketogulonicigenium vulgare WSH-001]ALJ81569.1 hypothetical protein KVH_10520 [Ketogulonicigenium vulgare]ANW35125.1 hypothetical protein KvSKV_10445 [Ketogulonicigenium vulgare]AOZ55175.1 hypothetical protein KVC_2168 [Ketogulonicigenium vulgare]